MEPFKEVFNPKLIDSFCFCINEHFNSFNSESFKSCVISNLEALELKDRSDLIADALNEYLPKDVNTREGILFSILHPLDCDNGPRESSNEGITSWGTLPMTTLVGKYGLGGFERSMEALRIMTPHFSSEFAIRHLILENHSKALKILESWVSHPDHHVRRLVSEGLRPRLPWAMQLPKYIKDPSPLIPILKLLRDDEEEYVRRSVANNLNDISKDHPDLIANLAEDWIDDLNANSYHASIANSRKKLIKHASRTLIKQGHPIALSAFGFGAPNLEKVELNITSEMVIFGEELKFDLGVRSTSLLPQDLIIDYVVHFKKKNGTNSPKVFKWTQKHLDANQSLKLTRKHPIKQITTRKYYEGKHYLSVRINGRDFEKLPFDLVFKEDPV